MPIQILDAVLPFAVDGFVEVLPDSRSLLLCNCVVSLDVRDHDREHLGSKSEFKRAFGVLARPMQHHVCVAEMHKNAADRLTVAVMLCKSEDPGKPVTSLRDAPVNHLGKQGGSGN